MEHERGGIDRLVSNHRLFLDCLPLAAHDDPLVRQEIAALETGYRLGRLLVLREVLGQAPKLFSAVANQDVLHRTRAACRDVLQRGAGAWAAWAWERPESRGGTRRPRGAVARGVVYSPAYTLMGGTTQILRTILADRVLGLPRV